MSSATRSRRLNCANRNGSLAGMNETTWRPSRATKGFRGPLMMSKCWLGCARDLPRKEFSISPSSTAGQATGERLYHEIRDRVAQCAEQALAGHAHPDAPAGWRCLKHKRWLIFFQPHPDGIEIM